MFVSNYCFLTCIQVSQDTGKIIYFHLFKNFPQFAVIHTVKGIRIVNEAEVDVFLELPCFLHEPMNVDNLISASLASSKPCLYIWKFLVHVLLKSSLKDFEHNLARMWKKHNCTVVWAFFGVVFLSDWNENGLFQCCGLGWVFQICWNIECSALAETSFRIWNSSTEIPSPPLGFFIVVLPKAHLTSRSRMSGHTVMMRLVVCIFMNICICLCMCQYLCVHAHGGVYTCV